jgi:adenine-specific DNA-methyltransferase
MSRRVSSDLGRRPARGGSAVELTWENKHLRPVASGDAYAWAPRNAVEAVPTLTTDTHFGEVSESMLIQGDASAALRALTNEAAGARDLSGRVKLCYIDPPYNTGEHFGHYKDRLERSLWLGVLREHLTEIKQLIAEDGSIWVHLDDSEQHRARCVLDEVYGPDAFVGTIIWQKRTTRDNRKAFSSMHDYIHVYAPMGPIAWKAVRNGLEDTGTFSNPDDDPRGPWRSVPMTVQAGHATASQFYTVVTPTGERHEPPRGRCWTYTRERLAQLDGEGKVYWPRGGAGKPRLKRYASEGAALAPFTIWTADDVGTTAAAKKALHREFPDLPVFDTPKPLQLLERIVSVATNPGDLVLDCYLGSGTTAVAAQSLGRPWICIERNPETVQNFAVPRLESLTRARGRSGFTLATCVDASTQNKEVGA